MSGQTKKQTLGKKLKPRSRKGDQGRKLRQARKKSPPVGKQPNRNERQWRIETVASWLAERPSLTFTKVDYMCWKKWKTTSDTAKAYFLGAKDQIRYRFQVARTEVMQNALAFYESVISDPTQMMVDRLRAQGALLRMLGAEAPTKIELSGPNGGAIPMAMLPDDVQKQIAEMSVDTLEKMVKQLAPPIETVPSGGADNGSVEQVIELEPAETAKT